MIIMKGADCIAKMQTMTDEGITCETYTPTADNTLKDLKTFFLWLLINPKYEKMLPTSNQPAHPQVLQLEN